jgi:hypothetical protein
MNSNKMYNQIMTLFGGLMSLFYGGIGLYIIFSPHLFNIDKALLVIFGSSLILYGLYRLYRTYQKIVELFFSDDNSE